MNEVTKKGEEKTTDEGTKRKKKALKAKQTKKK